MLLKEIAYWTYYFLSKNKSYGKSADTRIDSALIVSVLLFVNILTIVYIAEQHIGLNILYCCPVKVLQDKKIRLKPSCRIPASFVTLLVTKKL